MPEVIWLRQARRRRVILTAGEEVVVGSDWWLVERAGEVVVVNESLLAIGCDLGTHVRQDCLDCYASVVVERGHECPGVDPC